LLLLQDRISKDPIMKAKHKDITKPICTGIGAAFALGIVLLFGVEPRAQERDKSWKPNSTHEKQITTTTEDQRQSKPDGKSALSDHYLKWLTEEVVYIITPEERKVFRALRDEKDRESFIEQFWNRRNPDPKSARNEFKQKHYLRIDYANKHFESSIPGWKTDRGRILIMYGMPDRITSYPNGAIPPPDRPPGDTFPYEVWWYQHIDGIGDNIELEFVDVSLNNEYRLAMRQDDVEILFTPPD
jgi:GWxTD domain-containing protein